MARFRRATRIAELYGLGRFVADIEAGREFWREGDSIFHADLDWLAAEEFQAFFSQYQPDFPWRTAHQLRQAAIINLTRVMGGR